MASALIKGLLKSGVTKVVVSDKDEQQLSRVKQGQGELAGRVHTTTSNVDVARADYADFRLSQARFPEGFWALADFSVSGEIE